jgi:transcriptional regulator with XRE-family HTH domain
MDTRQAFATSLKQARKAKNLTQEDFSTVSSRTYLSTLERGLKSPTLDKIQELADTLEIHPLTLLVLTYTQLEENPEVSALIKKISHEIEELGLQLGT